MKNAPLHILQLRVTDYGVLKSAHITPDDGKPVILAGDNGQGKSTTLNAIESVLTGSKIAKPIRDGQSKALIQINLGDSATGEVFFTAERKLTANGGDALVIKDPEGKQVPSPAKFMASLIGSGSAIDPTEIMQALPGEKQETFAKRQAQTLLERLGLAEKMAQIESDIATQMDARKVKNSRVSDLERDVESNANYPANTPDAPVDVATIAADTQRCQEALQRFSGMESSAQVAQRMVNDTAERIQKLEHELAAQKIELQERQQRHRDASMAVVSGAESAELAQVTIGKNHDQLASANRINANVTSKLAHKAAEKKLGDAMALAHELTVKIEALRKSKTDLVKTAKLPVDDLEFTDAGLLYKGLPLAQESTGIQTRVCSLMAMAESPQCRVILLRNATLLNKANRDIIHGIAKDRGYQVWEEVFTETKPEDGLWIVEGEVK